MKVLLADDGEEKADLLIPALLRQNGISRDDIEHVQDIRSLREAVSKERFDLLFLDLLMPRRSDQEARLEPTLEFLHELLDEDGLLRPGKIIGLTADAAAADRAESVFKDQTWAIIEVDKTSDQWLKSASKAVEYLGGDEATRTYHFDYDVLIVTALHDPELTAVSHIPWNWGPSQPLDDDLFYRIGSFESEGAEYKAACLACERPGMVPAAITVTKAVAKLRPQFVVMSGICAGRKDDTNMGDAILADPAWDYQSGKRVKIGDDAYGFEPDPHHLDVPHFIRSRVRQLSKNKEKLRAIRDEWQGDTPGELALHLGPMATGAPVVADGKTIEEAASAARKVIGLEMEVYGVYSAVRQSPRPRPAGFAIKSVCDFGDVKKDDKYQRYAAYTSAQTIRHFFEEYMTELKGMVSA